MSEHIIDRIRMTYGDDVFLASEAMNLFTFKELPESVQEHLRRFGPDGRGGHASRAFSRELEGLGCTALPGRNRVGGRFWLLPKPEQAGRCQYCGRESGNVTYHERTCSTVQAGKDAVRIERAGAHARPFDQLSRSQRFRRGVTDLDVARVVVLLERGLAFRRLPSGPWVLRDPRVTINVPLIVQEMLRTALAREWHDEHGDHLVMAHVHMDDGHGLTACKTVGEDLGWMRVRMVSDLSLVDCLACEAAVSRPVLRIV